MALKQIIFLKNLRVIKIEVNVKSTKYVYFIIACIEFSKLGFYDF